MNPTTNAKYKILAIDGGSIRGIISALLLAEIEKRTQKQIFSLFDLIADTDWVKQKKFVKFSIDLSMNGCYLT